METTPDFASLLAALDEAIGSFPLATCNEPDLKLRRECHELVLVLTHARERAAAFQGLYQDCKGD